MTLPNPRAFGLRMTAAERAAGRFMRAPDGHETVETETETETDETETETETDETETETDETETETDETETDEEETEEGEDEALKAAKAELAKLKKQLKSFKGIDPKVARENAKKIAAAEKAARDAEKAKAKAEGNFERLREIQAEEAQAKITAADEARQAAERERDEARQELHAARVDTAFANSKFLQDETILSGPKAKRLFGDHVEVENGKVVVYDKPAGEAKRAKIMDSKGNPLPFNEAIQKVIEADADKDSLLKSKTKPGGGSSTQDGKTKQVQSRHAKLSQGIAKLRGK